MKRFAKDLVLTMTVLLDTSFLLASAFRQDQNHLIASETMQNLTSNLFVVEPVVVEIFYMMTTRMSHHHAVQFYVLLQELPFTIINIMQSDRQRMIELMQKYSDAKLDLADVAQVAVAERLNIKTIYTFDRRDFSIIRPKHADYLTLLP